MSGKNVEFELNIEGLREIMKSDGMVSILQSAGNSVASAAGDGYESSIWMGSYAAVAYVDPVTKEAGLDNYKNNTLLKSLGAAGLGM